MFQFLSGWIRTFADCGRLQEAEKFQFLSGRIRTQSAERLLAIIAVFQFLSGRIRTAVVNIKDKANFSFNSSPGGLGRIRELQTQDVANGFNSSPGGLGL